MKRGDVFRFTYKPGISEKSKLGDCFNGILVAKEYAPNKLYLEDTYWRVNKHSYNIEELRKIGTLKLICNLNDVFPISKKEYDKFKDNVKYSFLIWGNTMEFFVRKDAVNISKYIKNRR